MIIREMIFEDWNRVLEIYKQGIDSGKSTFTTKYPTYDEWDESHIKTFFTVNSSKFLQSESIF